MTSLASPESIGLLGPKFIGREAEAASHLQRFLALPADQFAIIKIGGEILADNNQFDELAQDLAALQQLGLCPAVVHGGGPQITAGLKTLGIDNHKEGGIRVTSKAAAEQIPGILGGLSLDLAQAVNNKGGKSKVMSSPIFSGNLTDPENYVAEEVAVEAGPVKNIISEKHIPIINSAGKLAVDQSVEPREQITPINVNADTAAVELAKVLLPTKFIFITAAGGVKNGDGEILSDLDSEQAYELLANGTISGGMGPKVKEAMSLLNHGVHDIVIASLEFLLEELLTDKGHGTLIHRVKIDK